MVWKWIGDEGRFIGGRQGVRIPGAWVLDIALHGVLGYLGLSLIVRLADLWLSMCSVHRSSCNIRGDFSLCLVSSNPCAHISVMCPTSTRRDFDPRRALPIAVAFPDGMLGVLIFRFGVHIQPKLLNPGFAIEGTAL